MLAALRARKSRSDHDALRGRSMRDGARQIRPMTLRPKEHSVNSSGECRLPRVWGSTARPSRPVSTTTASARDHAWLDDLTRERAGRLVVSAATILADYVHGGRRHGLVGPCGCRAATWAKARGEAASDEQCKVAGLIFWR